MIPVPSGHLHTLGRPGPGSSPAAPLPAARDPSGGRTRRPEPRRWPVGQPGRPAQGGFSGGAIPGKARPFGPLSAERAARITADAFTPLVAHHTQRCVIAFAVLLPGAAPQARSGLRPDGGGALTGHPPIRASASPQPPWLRRVAIGVHNRAGTVQLVKRMDPSPELPRRACRQPAQSLLQQLSGMSVRGTARLDSAATELWNCQLTGRPMNDADPPRHRIGDGSWPQMCILVRGDLALCASRDPRNDLPAVLRTEPARQLGAHLAWPSTRHGPFVGSSWTTSSQREVTSINAVPFIRRHFSSRPRAPSCARRP